MFSRTRLDSVVFCAALAAFAVPLSILAEENKEPTPEQVQFFESKVRPVLVERCQGCHGPDKQKSGLRLDSRESALQGGDSGAVIDLEKPDNSLLLDAIKYESLQMPPDRKLSDAEIAAITEWLKQGAPWPGAPTGAVAVRKADREVTQADREFWSFQPITSPSVPVVKFGWSRTPIDQFIQAKLGEKKLKPSVEAPKRELVRRLSFDLLGLPPTPEEVDAFVRDERPEAYEELVDRYLSSPRYGERWGRHWLDLVRFAQTNGYERDDEKPEVWRYRDYVIKSFNDDKPYDQFIREQLAGDELDEATDDGRVALGFYRLGVWDDEPDDKRQAEFDELDDMLSTTGSVFLGLTIGCCRCHSHKFDPLPQEDYYSLLAFIRNVEPYRVPNKDNEKVLFTPLQEGGRALTVIERPLPPPETHVLARGSAATPGAAVVPRFPKVLSADLKGETPVLPEASKNGVTSGRRRLLADWIASPQNPLTARVMANRLWHYHFGRGLVATPNDFGHTGIAPTHPELLDYLATQLIAGGWKLKPLHKQILLSATYRQSSSTNNAEAVAVDPANVLLWRQNLRRLEAESIRDAMLATSGQLNLEMTGRGVFPSLSAEVLSTQSQPGRGWDKSNPQQQARRSVYIFVKRTLGIPLLETFDFASTDSSQAARNTTTIAPQALILLNSEFSDRQADAFAERLLKEVGQDPVAQVDRAFRLALARLPSAQERQTALGYLERQRAEFRARPAESLAKSPAAESVPLAGWSIYGGEWKLREDGGYAVGRDPGAKALWDATQFADGEVEADVWVGEGSDAGLLLRATDPAKGTDAVHAYNINFATGAGRLRLGKHENNWRSLTEVRAGWERGSWQHVRVVLEGPRIQIFLNGGEKPLIDYKDAEPLKAGKVGFRTFQAEAAVRNIVIRTAGAQQDVPMVVASPTNLPATLAPPADRLALAAYCKVMLNLNEFLYID